jgi:hypothetical protein
MLHGLFEGSLLGLMLLQVPSFDLNLMTAAPQTRNLCTPP